MFDTPSLNTGAPVSVHGAASTALSSKFEPVSFVISSLNNSIASHNLWNSFKLPCDKMWRVFQKQFQGIYPAPCMLHWNDIPFGQIAWHNFVYRAVLTRNKMTMGKPMAFEYSVLPWTYIIAMILSMFVCNSWVLLPFFGISGQVCPSIFACELATKVRNHAVI